MENQSGHEATFGRAQAAVGAYNQGMDENPYKAPVDAAGPVGSLSAPPRHAGLGAAAISIAVVAALVLIAASIAEIVAESFVPDDADIDSKVGISLLICGVGGYLSELVAIGLGIASLFQRRRKKLFGILGIAIAVITIWAMISGFVRMAIRVIADL